MKEFERSFLAFLPITSNASIMPKLRMKPSTSTDEAILRATSRAQKSSRSKRRQVSESLSPPRNPPPIHDFDESSLPPEQAYKRTRIEEEEFEERLMDARVQDEGVGFYENSLYERQLPAYASSFGGAAGVAAGMGAGRGRGDGMDEEEYAEYVRAGMWRLKNKERLEWLEQQERLKKVGDEKERVEGEVKRKEEREKRKKLEERKKRKVFEGEEEARKRYEESWKKLQTLSKTMDLQFSDFPWPLFPPFALPPLSWPSINDITPSTITSFLLPETLGKEERKTRLRSAVLSYHPDRFERFVLKVPEEKEEVRTRVRELGLRVSQVLNEISKSV